MLKFKLGIGEGGTCLLFGESLLKLYLTDRKVGIILYQILHLFVFQAVLDHLWLRNYS